MAAPLLIVGASARAAAQSAIRSGFRPSAADMFADEDLCACCQTRRIDPYPRQLLEAARTLPSGPWMYTGALENHPAIVDQLAGERSLLGNRGATLRRVRDPLQVSAALRDAGFRFPATYSNQRDVPRISNSSQRWLTKPIHSCGGHEIACADPTAIDPLVEARELAVWQEYIAGESASAVFVAASGRAVLLGVTKQLIGAPWMAASEFGYAGSIGPWPVSQTVRSTLRQIGNLLAEQFQLVGLFGVDFVHLGDEVWTIEVNPRYTASLEVLERTQSLSSIAHHVAACQSQQLPTEPNPTTETCSGKLVLYAREPLEIGERFADKVRGLNRDGAWPQVADVPARGSTIATGWPICTVFATGKNESAVIARLHELASAVG